MTFTLKTLNAIMDNLTRPSNDKRRIRALMPRYLKLAGHGMTEKVVFAHDPAEMMRLINRAGGPTHFSPNGPQVRYDLELRFNARFFPINVDFYEGNVDESWDTTEDSFFEAVSEAGAPWPTLDVPHNISCLPGRIYTHSEAIILASMEELVTGQWPEKVPNIIQLYDAGVYCYAYSRPLTICLLRPKIYLLNGRLHRPDGPALEWPSRRNHTYAWRGTIIPGYYVVCRDQVTASEMLRIRNMEVRRAVIELIGPDKIMGRAVLIGFRDRFGILYDLRLNDEILRFVKVLNGTPNPDGSHKEYWLRVPTTIRTPHEGVAWSYGMTTETYNPDVRT